MVSARDREGAQCTHLASIGASGEMMGERDESGVGGDMIKLSRDEYQADRVMMSCDPSLNWSLSHCPLSPSPSVGGH